MKLASSQLHLVGGEHGVEQRHVRGVGGDAGVEQRVVGQLAVGPDPQALDGLLACPCCIQGRSPMWRWSMGWGRANQSAELVAAGLEALAQGRQLSGAGTSGMGNWCSKARARPRGTRPTC